MEKIDQRNEAKDCPKRKDWITPEIFDSPVIAVTGGTDSGTPSSDASSYS